MSLSVRAYALLLGLLPALGACASKSKAERTTLPYDQSIIDAEKDKLRHGPMGPLLASLDSEVRAWNNLALSATSERELRQARVLEQSLRYQGELRAEHLIAELQSDSVFNRQVAAVVLGFSGQPEALSPLLAALEDPSPEVESNALLGLAILEDPETPLGGITERLRDGLDSKTRINAAYALRQVVRSAKKSGAPTRSDEWLAAARGALADDEPGVRAQCAMLVAGELDRASIDHLSLLLNDEVPLSALASARALAYIGTQVPELKGRTARALTSALTEATGAQKDSLRQILMAMSRANYGDDDAEWVEWAHRLP